jgi:protein SCO1/2
MGFRVRTAGATAALVAAGLGLACHAKPGRAVHRYELHGTVLAVDRSRGQIVVRHDSIPGFMPAMTMPYAVANAQDLVFLENGDEIRADVVVDEFGSARLERIRVLRRATGAPD